jgi:5-methylcytosine-specific restriction endonuclease McrA
MERRLKEEVRRRAGGRCEYCRFPERFAELRFQVDHIIPEQHGGPTSPDNLALSCLRCNKYKGPNLAGLDPVTGEMVRLFDPRRDAWHEHFTWEGPNLVGLTPVGRATIQVLQINRMDAVLVREALMEEGVW